MTALKSIDPIRENTSPIPLQHQEPMETVEQEITDQVALLCTHLSRAICDETEFGTIEETWTYLSRRVISVLHAYSTSNTTERAELYPLLLALLDADIPSRLLDFLASCSPPVYDRANFSSVKVGNAEPELADPPLNRTWLHP